MHLFTCYVLKNLFYLYHSDAANLNMNSCSTFVPGTVSSFPSHIHSTPLLYFPVLEEGCFRFSLRPLYACFNSVKPHAVLITPGGEFCNASLFAFNPGRIKVLQFPKAFFCWCFSHEAIVSFWMGLAAARLPSLVKQKTSQSTHRANLGRCMFYA